MTAPVRIDLLGAFRVEGVAAWPTRRAAELVQLLALAAGHRLPREHVIDALWPTLDPEAGAANLRKAAHHARQALGTPDAVVLRGGQVSLLPAVTDIEAFEAGTGPYGGDLLPEALYEEWTQAPRARLRGLHLDRLREASEWERLVEDDPTDESAYGELMRRELAEGRRPAAIRWYGRLRTALRRELGLRPSPETQALYDECVAELAGDEPVFVGRQLELARAAALFSASPPGDFALLAVRGEGGIGKSALCRELARAVTADGWTVFAVAATEDGGPYAPLVDVAERLASENPALLEAIGAPARAVLEQLARPTPDSELTRHRVIGAFRRLLVAAAGDRLTLIFDDAHLADEATLDALQHLGSESGTPIVLVLAYRPEPAPPTLTRAVARLYRAGRVTPLDLGPLGHDDAAALVEAGASTPRDEETRDRIIALSQGNPFLTLELARSAVAGVPALASVAGRYLDLADSTLATLRGLALAGDDLDPASAVALAAPTEDAALAALDDALASGVLIVDGARYRFRHELVRQALVEQLAPHQQKAAHRETATRLAAAGAAPGLIARHWLAGGRPAEAVAWLLEAAREAVRLGAFADALAHLEPLLAQEPAHPGALRLRAQALDARGDQGAPAAYAAAAAVAEEADAHELRALGALATIKLGDPAGGLELLEGVAPTTLNGRIAHALAFAGAAALGFGDPAVGSEKAAEARRLALESGDPAAVTVASWAQAAAAHARGELRDSVRADLDETHALPQLALSAFDGQLCITQRLLYGARPYPDVIGFADALASEADRLGAERGRAFAVTIRGEARLLAGDLDAADADLAAGVKLHRAMGAATGEAFGLQRRAEVALHRGQRAQAVALLDEALAIARESDVGYHLFDRIYGTIIRAAEDPASALAALEEAEAAVRGPEETCPGCRITLAVPAAIAAARAGDAERTAQWTEAAGYLAETVMRLPAWYAALDEIKGHAATDQAEATDHFRKAAEGFAAAGHPLDEARCVALSALARS